MPTITTCSVQVQIPQWLRHDLSRPGSSPTTLTVTHKELSMGGDGCVSPQPLDLCLSWNVQLLLNVENDWKDLTTTGNWQKKKKIFLSITKNFSDVYQCARKKNLLKAFWLEYKWWLTSLAAPQRGGVLTERLRNSALHQQWKQTFLSLMLKNVNQVVYLGRWIKCHCSNCMYT